MTQFTTGNRYAPDATKRRSRRLFWRLVSVLVALVISTFALIGYRIHRRYTILSFVVGNHEEAFAIENDYPYWIHNLLDDYRYGLESISFIDVHDAPAEHLGLIKELNPEELSWYHSDKSVYRFPEEGGHQIRGMTRLKFLRLSKYNYGPAGDVHNFVVSEEVLSEAARSPSLEAVRFDNMELQGSPFSALTRSSTIRTIILGGCAYPESDLSQLHYLESLKSLDLSGNEITDQVLISLHPITQLESLSLRDTDVSDEAIDEFKKAVPGCRVVKQ